MNGIYDKMMDLLSGQPSQTELEIVKIGVLIAIVNELAELNESKEKGSR